MPISYGNILRKTTNLIRFFSRLRSLNGLLLDDESRVTKKLALSHVASKRGQP